jgi:hypothetical protein
VAPNGADPLESDPEAGLKEMARSARATVQDIHDIALGMPGVERESGTADNAVYTVRRKSFVFFRNPRPDALDQDSGERLTDVVVFWVESEAEKRSLVADESTPFFTTAHFDGYPAVLLRSSRVGELDRDELAEIVAESWLARAPKRLAAEWLETHPDWPAGS